MRSLITRGVARWLLCSAFLLAGCGGNNTYNPTLISGGGGPAASFTLSVKPDSVNVAPGQSAIYTATLTAVDGFATPVNLSVNGLPADATAVFAPPAVTPSSGGAISTLTVTTSSASSGDLSGTIRSRAATPAGTYTLTVTATGGSLTRQDDVILIVEPVAQD